MIHCHGCFDIVHPGHIRHLRQAKQLGDVLLITITGDASVGKGAGRPLIPQELRAENLAALDFVDWVCVEPGADAAGLLAAVRPDVYVKGQEYESNQHPGFAAERRTVEAHGGRVVFTSGDVVFSSTALIAGMASSIDPADARLSELLRHPALHPERLQGLLAGFRGLRVVVVGEVIEDSYVFCDPPGVAGESPVLSLRPVQERCFDGGAAVVARHLAALGADVTLVTALPRDAGVVDGLRSRLGGEGVSLAFVEQETPLARKQRFLVGHEKVVKIDWVRKAVLDAGQQDRLVAVATERARAGVGRSGGCDAAVVTDFGLGLFSGPLLERMTDALRPLARVLTGDVSGQRNHLASMRRMDLVTPSESELRASARLYDESLPAVAWRHLSATDSAAMLVTMGAEGLVTFEPLDRRTRRADGGDAWQTRLRSEHVPALCPHVVDALGCGDALLAAATMTLASGGRANGGGGSLLEAAFVGALAASIHGSRVGNSPVDFPSLRRRVEALAGMTGPSGTVGAGGHTLGFVPGCAIEPGGLARATHLAS